MINDDIISYRFPWPLLKARLRAVAPDWARSIRNYCGVFHKFPNILSPVTFNEKLLCRNLFDRRAILTAVAGKATAREFVESRLGPAILSQLYHLTTEPETIPFDQLPQKFVVKPSHGSGWIHLVKDRASLDRAEIIEKCKKWLAVSYYKMTAEWVYKNITPQILVEEFVDDGTGNAPIDYKFFVFGGAVEFIQVDVGRFTDHRRCLYSPDWRKLNVLYHYPDAEGEIPPPIHLEEMLAIASNLGTGFDFIRVDLYDCPHRVYFGELTCLPGAGHEQFDPPSYDLYLGSRWPRRMHDVPANRRDSLVEASARS